MLSFLKSINLPFLLEFNQSIKSIYRKQFQPFPLVFNLCFDQISSETKNNYYMKAAPTIDLPSYLRCSPFFNQSSNSCPINHSNFKPNPSQSKENHFVHNILLGFKLLLSAHAHLIPTQHTFLGLKIRVESNHKKILGDLDEVAVATHGKDLLAYELEAEDAIGIILDFEEYWTHSCSITFTEASRLVETNLTSDIRGRGSPENNESDSKYAEVMLFIIIDGQIDDKGISNCEQLQMFLKQNIEKIIVHVTCSSSGMQEKHPHKSHLIFRYSEESKKIKQHLESKI
ncbi:uncharacterized protein LOC130797807 isoform X2 [Amaranthus tricolor]|uniref:uncharacterized protein LOC130797807 isoform X2 n=1 Tax=Amaranthus tricolor TaxID=29722 RepID=UPI00258666A5|nr:uncharacterized protein LOC130797807 isoform X2 [Amaranthus tricolor]